jgi:hypothetical protein
MTVNETDQKYREHLKQIERTARYWNLRSIHPICIRLQCASKNRCLLEAVGSCTYFLEELKYILDQGHEVTLRKIICGTCGCDVTDSKGHGRASCREFNRRRAL